MDYPLLDLPDGADAWMVVPMNLRSNLFKTLPRERTDYIAVRDTITEAKEDIDAVKIDALHCRQGRLGIGYHFLILTNGNITLGRHIETVGSHSKRMDDISVAIGIVGGLVDKVRTDTRNLQQIDALEDLKLVLQERYPNAEVHDRPQS